MIDVGVNIGRFLVYAAAADASRAYFGFEVQTACTYYVKQLIAPNQLQNATVFPVGLSDYAGLATLRAGSGDDVG